MISVRTPGGALVNVQPMMRNAGNALVPVTVVSRDPGGNPATTQPPVLAFSLTIDPMAVAGAVNRPSGMAAYTNEAAATALGGVGAFVYAWVSQSGGMTATSPSSATTRFTAFVAGGDVVEDTFTCTVTDATGATASATITATVSNYGMAQ